MVLSDKVSFTILNPLNSESVLLYNPPKYQYVVLELMSKPFIKPLFWKTVLTTHILNPKFDFPSSPELLNKVEGE